MIKFFRKIRQNLVSENKFSKYLLYAFGEIVLVVIGILLALAINDWNNTKKIKRQERATLQKLVQDLNSDKSRFQKNIEYYKRTGDYLSNAKKIIFKKSLTDEDIKEVMNFFGAVHRDLNPRTTTYKEMLNSGRIYNLSSESLVNEILNYYQFLDESIYQNKENRREFRNLFYGAELTDFWSWKADENPFPDAKKFFSNTNSNSYKILKQSSGWSEVINKGLLDNSIKLLELNEQLISSINQQLGL